MANGNDTDQHVPESGFSIVNAISVLVVAGFFVVIGTVQWIIPDNASAQVLSITNMLIGALVASFTTVVNYHFGSTKTSARSADTNRETIKALANTAASTAATAASTAATAAAGTGPGTTTQQAPPTTTTTTTTETRVDPGPDPVAAAIASLDASQGVRGLDTAWTALLPTTQNSPAVQAHYQELREARTAAL